MAKQKKKLKIKERKVIVHHKNQNRIEPLDVGDDENDPTQLRTIEREEQDWYDLGGRDG